MKLKDLIKTNPGLQYVADSLELMSSAGRRVLLNTEFSTNAAVLEAEWERTSQAIKQFDSHSQPLTDLRHCLMQLHDLQGTIASLQSHVPLNEVELFEVKNLAYLNRQARVAIAALGLDSALSLPDLSAVFSLLDPDATGLPSFYIYDSYDHRLSALRREMNALQISGGDPERTAALSAIHNDVQQEVCLRLSDLLRHHCVALAEAMETLA